VLQILQTE
jgi:hypothetical protein